MKYLRVETINQPLCKVLIIDTQNLRLPELRLQDPMAELHPLMFKDLPCQITSQMPKELLDFIASSINKRSSVAIIWKTTDNLEIQYYHCFSNVTLFYSSQ